MSLSKVRNAFARWQSCNVIWERSYTVSFMVAKADFQSYTAHTVSDEVFTYLLKEYDVTIENNVIYGMCLI